MAFPNRLLTPSTWRILGLGLTTTIFGLGAWSITTPLPSANSLGVIPTTPEGQSMVEKGMVFLGARDLCIATTLFCFYREGKQREMGMLLTSATIIYAFDLWIAAQGPRSWDGGVWGLCAGSVVGTFVGLGLLQS